MLLHSCDDSTPCGDRATVLLRATVEGTARATGPEFFARAVTVLAEALQIRAATVSVPVAGRSGWHRLVAGTFDGQCLELPDTRVIRTDPRPSDGDRLLVAPADFQIVRDGATASGDAISWFAALELVDAHGQLLGHLGLGHSSPVTFTSAEEDSLRIFAARIAGELQRERTDTDLRAAADLRERIIATAPIGVMYLDLRTLDGWSNDRAIEILGSSFDIAALDGHRDLIHPDDRAEFDRCQHRLLTFGDPLDLDLRIRRQDGEERCVQLHAAAGFGADGQPTEVTVLLIDRTRERRATAALEDYTAELEGSLHAFADTHFQLDATGTFHAVRSRRSDTETAPDDPIVGSTLADRCDTTTARRILDAISATLAGEELPPLRYTVTHEGEPIHYEARFAALSHDRVIMVKRDATDIHRLEQQLVHAAAMQSVGRLAGGIAHDFNNVLHVIRGHAAALERHADDPASTRKRIDAITGAVDRTTTLVDQLMQISRPAPARPTASPVDEFLEHLGFGLTRMVSDDVELEFRLDAPGVAVVIDDSRFENVILNLVANATDAMPDGGTIAISTRADGATNVTIEVTDDGDGMDAATESRVFEPLFTTKSPGIGTGLGLATSYSTVTDAGGTMTVRSELGVGTTFTITLPVADTHCAVSTETCAAATSTVDANILVVDDDADVLDLCAGALRDAGFSVHEAPDGPSALDVIASGERVDLLLTDVTMPKMSGTDLAQQARSLRGDLPIVFMSGLTSNTGGPSLDGNVERFLRKPFSDDVLLETIERHLVVPTPNTIRKGP